MEGHTRRDWTTLEERFLRESAGALPLTEICERLGRSKASVRAKARELGGPGGGGLSLTCYESRLLWCDACSTWRTRLFKSTGECVVCRLRHRLARCQDRCRAALDCLPPEPRDRFDTSVRPGIRLMPPRPPQLDPREGASRCERDRAEEDHLKLVERWEARCLRMRINAEKSRLLRLGRATRRER